MKHWVRTLSSKLIYFYFSQFRDDLWESRKSGEFCNVTVRFQSGVEILAHKVVLSTGSPIFKAQFSSQLKADNDVITVTGDVEDMATAYQAMQQVLADHRRSRSHSPRTPRNIAVAHAWLMHL